MAESVEHEFVKTRADWLGHKQKKDASADTLLFITLSEDYYHCCPLQPPMPPLL